MSSLSALALATVVGLGTLLAAPANAADFSINPTRVTLDSKRTVDTLTLTSNEDREVSFEVALFKWEQKPGGEWVETPSKDLVVYPALLNLAPKSKGILRVGTKIKGPVDTEASYRLILQELPGGPAPEGTAVRLLTRVSLPVFVQPTTPNLELDLTAERSGNNAKLTVINNGNIRLDPQSAQVEFLDASGNVIGQSAAAPGPAYVLSGASSTWMQSFKDVSCSSVHSVKVSFEAKKTVVSTPLTGSCK